jgi:hypothetical protein
MPHTVLLELLDGERPTPPVLNGVEIVAPTDGEIAADLHLQAVLRFNRRCWSGSPKGTHQGHPRSTPERNTSSLSDLTRRGIVR